MILKSIAIATTIISLVLPTAVLAEDTAATASPKNTREKALEKLEQTETKASAKAEKTEKVKAKLNERAATEIDRRIAAMNKLITRLAKMKRLSADTQSSLKTKVESEITKLTALKAKIAAETDAAAIKTDVESIKSSYRIFAVFMPQISLLAASDSILGATETLTQLSTKLQARLDKETANPDLSTMKTSLAEMNNMINAAKTQAANIQTTVIALTPEGYPDNQATLKSAREMVKTAHESLQSARKAAESIIKALKLKKSPSPSSSLSPTSSPSL
jgi:hypothetical protein